MPRYYFDFTDGQREDDNQGTELSGLDDAMAEAVRVAARNIIDCPELVSDTGRFGITVSDETGERVGGVEVKATQNIRRFEASVK